MHQSGMSQIFLRQQKKYMRATTDKRFKMVLESGELKNAIRAYLASIAYIDTLVGHFLDALENSKYFENTVIVFWSDHGYQFGEKTTNGKTVIMEKIFQNSLHN